MDYILPLIPQSIRSLPVHMDFHGQKKAEKTFQLIILLFGAVGFVWGYVCQQFSQTMYILLAGVVLSCILTLPPWPMYRKNPLAWQKPKVKAGEGDNTSASSPSSTPSSQQQKSKKKKWLGYILEMLISFLCLFSVVGGYWLLLFSVWMLSVVRWDQKRKYWAYAVLIICLSWSWNWWMIMWVMGQQYFLCSMLLLSKC